MRRRPPPWARSLISLGIAAAVLGGLVVLTGPMAFARAISRFPPALVPLVMAAAAGALVLQGFRWHLLLRELPVGLRAADSVLISVAGQAITAVLPLGDLTRAVWASEVAKVPFGEVAATVTVQELTFTLMLVLAGIPGLIALHQPPYIVGIVIFGVVAILCLLLVPPVFHVVHKLVAHTPVLRRFTGQVDELQRETVVLLHRPDTAAWSIFDLLRVGAAVTTFWLVVAGLAPGAVPWWDAGFVLAVSYVGGALSLIPGGAGATEATTVGALLLVGLDGGTAAAAALLQRAFVSGVAAGLGLCAYFITRRRLGITGLGLMLRRHPGRQA